ncbi:MAG: hypothetical protein H0X01_01125 [Nitrospira sp.]|nr:hypothetical protein [Nitrospira sp.]
MTYQHRETGQLFTTREEPGPECLVVVTEYGEVRTYLAAKLEPLDEPAN